MIITCCNHYLKLFDLNKVIYWSCIPSKRVHYLAIPHVYRV